MAVKWHVTGVVCLVGAAVGTLAQAVVTPIGSGDSATAQVAAAVAHPGRMAWAAGLDLFVLLLVPALAVVGWLAGAARSRFAALAFGVSLVSVLGGCAYLLAVDPMVLAATRQPDPAGAARLIDGYTGTGLVTTMVLVYLIGHLIGFILLAVALVRARAVPVWAAVAIGLWPVGEMASAAAGQWWLTVLAYALLVVGFGACAAALSRGGRPAFTPAGSLATAGANG